MVSTAIIMHDFGFSLNGMSAILFWLFDTERMFFPLGTTEIRIQHAQITLLSISEHLY